MHVFHLRPLCILFCNNSFVICVIIRNHIKQKSMFKKGVLFRLIEFQTGVKW